VTDIRFARSGDVDIAYHVVGDGPVDLVYVEGAYTHLEVAWELPQYRRWCRAREPEPYVRRFESVNAVSTSVRCVNACGKFPTRRPLSGSYSSAIRPRSLRRESSRS
jgi:hypothetical protein